MKKIYSLMFSMILCSTINGQQSPICVSHDAFEKLMQQNATFKTNQEQLENETQAFVSQQEQQRPSSASYILPIVFHVIYTTPSGNISDAQVRDQVAILNTEFNRLQADTILTPAPFKSLAAPFAVEFRLATIDPNGNCTTGIEHIYNSLANCSYPWDAVKALSDWPSNQYINIWLIETMKYPNTSTCNGGGYSTFPGGPAQLDGIVIRSDLIGSIGTAASTSWGNWQGRYLIHELGHWFNLRHIWGDANCGNDQVADTPPAVFSNSGCPSFPHNANNSCGSGVDGEMYTDYMDYTEGFCLNMFSAGQVTRMTAAINSSISGRNNLWSNANLLATGTASPPAGIPNCVAIPEMNIKDMIYKCAGDSVKMISLSYGGTASSRLWTFPGGIPASSSDSIVWVKYTSPGIYPVILTNNLQTATKTYTFDNRVCVFATNANSLTAFPYNQDFESQAGFDNSWKIYNRDKNSAAWEITDTTSYTGAQCIRLKNFGTPSTLTDDFISNSFDLSSVQSASLSFRVAFTGIDVNSYDKLSVSISDNCGVLWYTPYQRNMLALKTSSLYLTNQYVPDAGGEDWRLEKITINPIYFSKKVQFKFSFSSGAGNNIYIDDINLDGITTVGIKKETRDLQFFSYPNPTSDEWFLNTGAYGAFPLTLEIRDVSGRLIQIINVTEPKQNVVSINTTHLNNGAYLVTVKKNDYTIYSSKLIVVH